MVGGASPQLERGMQCPLCPARVEGGPPRRRQSAWMSRCAVGARVGWVLALALLLCASPALADDPPAQEAVPAGGSAAEDSGPAATDPGTTGTTGAPASGALPPASPLPPSLLPPTRAGGRSLESLLRPRKGGIPPAKPEAAETRGGRTRAEWAARFDSAREEIAQLETALAETRVKVGEASTGGYTYSPVGGGPTSDPEVVKLRAQLRRDKQSLEAAERRLRELEVEASLQSVPEDWVAPAKGKN